MKKRNILFALCALLSCQGQKEPMENPNGYDLGSPEKIRMRESLLEISGIAFTSKDELYAVQDEEGQLYRVALADGRILYSSLFGKKGDYEDLAVTDNRVVVLRSDGALLTFPTSEVGKRIQKVSLQKEILPKGEYEGIFGRGDSVFVLCKECKKDKGGKFTSGYVLGLKANGKLFLNREFKINVHEICEAADKKKLHFRPSALAQHPQSKDWFLLSSVNRILVITDSQWKVKGVYSLNPPLFLQPEGIAFDSQSNLYISNEGDEISNGSVFKYRYLH